MLKVGHHSAGAIECDLLIVGSGPVGSSVARLVAEERPNTSIVIVELGPALTDPAGDHITNIAVEDRSPVYAGSQGPESGQPREAVGLSRVPSSDSVRGSAPSGLHFIFSESSDMPAAAAASAVGGMGAYWGGVAPRPSGSEVTPFIAPADWQSAITKAETILGVRAVFEESAPGAALRDLASEALADLGHADPRVSHQPVAGQVRDRELAITGPGSILVAADGFLEAGEGQLTLLPRTLCRKLVVDGTRATGAVLEDLATGAAVEVRARAVVIAADAFRSPQLLWASGIRPAALGRHLMDHPIVSAVVELKPDLITSRGTVAPSVSCVPFDEGSHPFHGILLQGLANLVPGSWVRSEDGEVPVHLVSLSWLGRVWPRSENRVTFSDEEQDWCGLPAMSVVFGLNDLEIEEQRRALAIVERLAGVLGAPVPGLEPAIRPLGTSLHYTGTVRMGADQDTSVCNSRSKVWGTENVFVAGNGVIHTATTVNPTLTSVAFAVQAVPEIVRVVSASNRGP